MSRLDQVDPAGRVKVIMWKKVGPTRNATLLSKKGYLARLVTLIANPTFCLSCQWFDKFNKEIQQTFAGRSIDCPYENDTQNAISFI